MTPREMLTALLPIREAIRNREDADCTGDPPRMRGNKWMHLGTDLDEIMNLLEEWVDEG